MRDFGISRGFPVRDASLREMEHLGVVAHGKSRVDGGSESKTGPRPGKRGSVLMLALVLMAVLASLTVSGVVSVSSSAIGMRRLRERAEARRAALEAVTLFAVELRLLTNGFHSLGQSWAREHVPISVGSGVRGAMAAPRFSGNPAGGAVDCESRINLNTAGRDLLSRVFVAGAGLDAEAANLLADSVLVWRGQIDSEEETALERARYETAGCDWAPPASPMATLETLRLMPGGGDLDLDALSEWATVHGGGKININTAGLDVLAMVFYSAAGREVEAAGRLLARMRDLRARGYVFESAASRNMGSLVKAFDGITPEEVLLLSRIAERLDVQSRCFEARAMGGVDAVSPEGMGEVRFAADFVWDAGRGKMVYWRE